MLGQERPEKDGTGRILSSVDLSVSVCVQSSEFGSLKVKPHLTKVLGARAPQDVEVLKYVGVTGQTFLIQNSTVELYKVRTFRIQEHFRLQSSRLRFSSCV